MAMNWLQLAILVIPQLRQIRKSYGLEMGLPSSFKQYDLSKTLYGDKIVGYENILTRLI